MPISAAQLAAELREEIAAGKYDGTGRIPSLTQLRDRTGLSLNSVQRAVSMLKADGLVRGVPGRGVYLAPR
jgi:DNA-binding GntR family transcriptional regulator